MMSKQLPVGTVVYLKIGSPPMITNSLRRDSKVSVEWFGKDGTLHRDAFDRECVFVETPDLKELRARCLNNMRAHMRNGSIEGLPGSSDAAAA